MQTNTQKFGSLKWTDLMKPEDVSVKMMWEVFANQVMGGIRKDSVQYAEMQKAFYAGFFECFKVVNDMAVVLSEEQAATVLGRLDSESHEFFERMVKQHGLG